MIEGQGTHYDTLGLAPGATAEDIDDQYRAIAKVVHPDAGGDAITFSVLHEAYAVLSDPARRAAYDRLLLAGPDPSPPDGTGPLMRPSTPSQRTYAEDLANAGMHSWHQTPSQYLRAIGVSLRRRGIAAAVGLLIVLIIRVLT